VATIAEVFALARQNQQTGNFSQAEQLYRQILQADPSQAEAWGSLAMVCQAQGKLDQAEMSLRRVARLVPGNGSAYNCLAIILVQQNKLDEAAASLREALRCQPDNAEAHNNLGSVLARLGRTAEAIDSYRQALRFRSNYARAHYNLGLVLRTAGQQGAALMEFQEALRCQPDCAEALHELGNVWTAERNLAEAESSYRQALRLRPDRPETHHNLAIALQSQGRLEEAAACCQQALRLNPNFAEAHFTLGTALQGQGRLDEAMASYHQALGLNPNFAEAHYNLGKALQSQCRLEEAVACFRRALLLNPNFAEAHTNLGSALQYQGRLEEAVACYRHALRLNPDFTVAHHNLGHALRELGKLDEAVACCRRAAQLEPDNPGVLGQLVYQLQQLCLWQDCGDLAQRVIDAVANDAVRGGDTVVDPFLFLALPTSTTADQHRQCARQWVEHLKPVRGPKSEVRSQDFGHRTSDFGLPTSHIAPSRITVGYLSADFHEHATAYLIAELIEKHDRERFAAFAYSLGSDDGSPMRRRLVKAFDRFMDLKDASFVAAAQRIQADEVDILVDLKGYTRQARTQIMALRPAPIQVNYLGYPGTMAAPFIDYILVDDFVVPPDQQPFFTEKLVHLPGCYQVNDSQRPIAAHTPPRAECGLPEAGFVFCCFNSTYKITSGVFDVWMRLLKAIPGSVLWLLEDNPVTSANLRREAQARGVMAERLVFAPRLALAEHLARHRLADLFLDTLPYNAHTTASDALWAGCPVLTAAGQTFPSRVAGSLLRTIGLPELITTSLQEYEEMALRLAGGADLLNDLRARLQANRKTSLLFDGGQFARSLEQAFGTMWEIYTSGEEPRSFTVPTRE